MKIYIYDEDAAYAKALATSLMVFYRGNEFCFLGSDEEAREIAGRKLLESERFLICEEKEALVSESEAGKVYILSRDKRAASVLPSVGAVRQQRQVRPQRQPSDKPAEILVGGVSQQQVRPQRQPSGRGHQVLYKYSGASAIYGKLLNMRHAELSEVEGLAFVHGVSERGGAGLTSAMVALARELSLHRGHRVFFMPMTEVYPRILCGAGDAGGGGDDGGSAVDSPITDAVAGGGVTGAAEECAFAAGTGGALADFAFDYFFDKEKTMDGISGYVKEDEAGVLAFAASGGERNYLTELSEGERAELVLRLAEVFGVDYFICDYGTNALSLAKRQRFPREKVLRLGEDFTLPYDENSFFESAGRPSISLAGEYGRSIKALANKVKGEQN
jgi:hypothetical protein